MDDDLSCSFKKLVSDHLWTYGQQMYHGIEFTVGGVEVKAWFSLDDVSYRIQKKEAAIKALCDRFHLSARMEEHDHRRTYFLERDIVNKDPRLALLKQAFELLNDTDMLEDMLACLSNEDRDELYSHPILKDFDLLP